MRRIKNKSNNVWYISLFEKAGIIGVIVLIWAVLFGLMDLVVMPLVTGQGREFDIPDVVEKDLKSARRVIKKTGFKVHSDIEKRFDPYHPSGLVIEQFPPPNTRSKLGRKVRLAISAGEKLYPVPDVVGISEKEARMKIGSDGFRTIDDSIEFIFSDYYPEGVVAEQSMPAGSELTRGSFIGLTVSVGQEPKKFAAPDVTTLRKNEARRALAKAGMTIGYIEFVYFPVADSGIVVKQEPSAGTKVEKFSPVNLQFSGGTNPDEVDSLLNVEDLIAG